MKKEQKEEKEELTESPVVVAVDPGGVTGWSVLQIHPEALVNPDIPILANIEHWSHGQIKSPANDTAEQDCVSELVGIVAQWPGCCVLMEDFILRMFSMGRELLAPVRLNAMLAYALRTELGIEITHRQQPSQAKTIATDERMKEWGLYEREGGMEHARDADRHAIVWMRNAKDPMRGYARRALWWPHLYGAGAPYYVAPKAAAGQVGGGNAVTLVAADSGKTPAQLAAVQKPIFQGPGNGQSRRVVGRKRSGYK